MTDENDTRAVSEAVDLFKREVGIAIVETEKSVIGNQTFLNFVVGKEAPIYTEALFSAQHSLSPENPYRGALKLKIVRAENFPNSLEAKALLTLLTRSTREVSQDTARRGYSVPSIPFQNGEDYQLSQPASHIVRGRRGVGKSTLIRRAVRLLADTPAIYAVLDMQSYSSLQGVDLIVEVLQDVCSQLAQSAKRIAKSETAELTKIAHDISSGAVPVSKAPITIKRAIAALTAHTSGHAFVFLDDFHLIAQDDQPRLLDTIHASLKGANGWIKVAGLSSLLNVYSPKERKGLQVPGDAQFIQLDLTLENPAAAERHLRYILESFLKAVGYSLTGAVLPEQAFVRLAYATAGVPRDFLQMFARALEHAQKNWHSTVTLSDVNVAIGEAGQQKMDELERDARNEADALKNALRDLEALCLDGVDKVPAFLVRSVDSPDRALIHALSDLRMVHLINRSITPDRAGERYEAYIIDYSIFTGFRRRPLVREMVPEDGQFKASELRALPKFSH